MGKTFIAIDLKSFFASVECVDRHLDPLNTNLVVADISRTEKTICLAVTPCLKRHGIPGRARLFEVNSKVKEINNIRRINNYGRDFTGKSFYGDELDNNPSLMLDFIVAPPRMNRYIEVSSKVYSTYLKYISPDDIHVYSIDEVFIDATDYLKIYKMNGREFAQTLIKSVLKETGITATAGIGTNLYLCKIAMDIEAKHIEADEYGVRIAELDEYSYRNKLWDHTPLTDFWRIGKGLSERLKSLSLYTMGDIARMSICEEEKLFKVFGINAELIIDHAWGYESCQIKDIKNYKSENNSISIGQVLSRPYVFNQARIIMQEMIDSLVLDLVAKNIKTNQILIVVTYDSSNLDNISAYKGQVSVDYYGRKVPKEAKGNINLEKYTYSQRMISENGMKLFDKIADRSLYIRRLNLIFNRVKSSNECSEADQSYQLTFFDDPEKIIQNEEKEKIIEEKEDKLQKTVLNIKNKYGKNSLVKGLNLQQGATGMDRNKQVGGHKA